ncbi:MAG: hypothetical protein IJT36_07345 [Alphaproteobacteria bacterium]|nr:hypothetical protein [Alphaproteobacteria bacterium]
MPLFLLHLILKNKALIESWSTKEITLFSVSAVIVKCNKLAGRQEYQLSVYYFGNMTPWRILSIFKVSTELAIG